MLERTTLSGNAARRSGADCVAGGGGIFNNADRRAVAITHSVVTANKPNNCTGPGTPIRGCTG
jgi:hypothetical protein